MRIFFPDPNLGFQSEFFEEILKNVVDRDHQDSTRAISPLRKAEEAVEIDTSLFSVEEVFEQMMSVVKA